MNNDFTNSYLLLSVWNILHSFPKLHFPKYNLVNKNFLFDKDGDERGHYLWNNIFNSILEYKLGENIFSIASS